MGRFVPAKTGIEKIDNARTAREARWEAARAVANKARELAPDGGPYKGVRERIRPTVVAAKARVEVRDFAWHLIEYGSVKNPPYAPLRRAVTDLGLRLEEAPRGD